MSWQREVVTLELRRLFAYRVDFWLSFAGSVVIELAIAYFLWSAIFEARGAQAIGGMSFHAMMLYYLLVPLAGRAVRGPESHMAAQEIYDGTLTRYLVYPLSYFGFRYVSHAASQLVAFVQLGLTLALFILLFGLPEGSRLGVVSLTEGLLAIAAGGYLYFAFATSLELVGFWAENVWSLVVMLRFVLLLLGGGFVPLTLFPDWARALLPFTPFPYMISFPIRALSGQESPASFLAQLAATLGWSLLLSFVAAAVWRRGTKVYTGVGI